MAEANIPMNAMIFCCEWDTNSLHTILSYVFKSMSNDMGCGKTLAHWNYKVSSDIYGGILLPFMIYELSLKWLICLWIFFLFTKLVSSKKQN